MRSVSRYRASLLFALFLAIGSFTDLAYCQTARLIDNTSIPSLVVNGGADTLNSGTSCIRIADPPSPQLCSGGLIAIPNNNKQLLAAASMARMTNSRVWVYYYDQTSTNYNCAAQAVTSCSLVSIELK